LVVGVVRAGAFTAALPHQPRDRNSQKIGAILASTSAMAVRDPSMILRLDDGHGVVEAQPKSATAQHCPCRALLYFRMRID
jgi:hypothetical protein